MHLAVLHLAILHLTLLHLALLHLALLHLVLRRLRHLPLHRTSPHPCLLYPAGLAACHGRGRESLYL